MKIGYLLELGEEIRKPPYNGPANHVRQVFTQLVSSGHTVHLLFRYENRLWITHDLDTYKPVIAQRSEKGWLRIIERIVRRIQADLRLPYLGLFESIRFANACLQELNEIELYYERYSWMTYGGLLAARWKHIPWIAEYNGDPIRDLQAKNMAPTGIQKRLSEMITRWTLGTANAIVASGEGWKQNCIRYWKVKPHKTVVVENGTDLLGILTRDDLNVFRPLEEAREPVKFVYLGGFYPWHGIDKLLIAFKGALRSGVEAQLVLIGSGAGFGEARQLAQRLELDDRVEFTGSLDTGAYAKYLAEADIGVSPYCGWNEYSGLKIFDYKAAGLACIASGENGQPATLKHGETGWIVPPCDQAALEEAIIMLGRDLVLRRKLGQAARIDAEERNSWSYTAQQLENIFNEIVQR